jgi:hypothetical protein
MANQALVADWQKKKKSLKPESDKRLPGTTCKSGEPKAVRQLRDL